MIVQLRRRLYVVLAVLFVLVSVFVLVVTNTTLPLNDEIQAMTKQVRVLKDENRLLEMQIFQETRLEIVDKKATEQGMTRPSNITYFRVARGYDAY